MILSSVLCREVYYVVPICWRLYCITLSCIIITHTCTHTHLQRHGKGKIEYSTGQVFEGEFVNNIINGEGEMRYSKVSKYHGNWLNGMVRIY